jgi:hypothetical protein
VPAPAHIGARRLRLLFAVTIAATLLPAAGASALPGSDNFQDAPALLFSVPGAVNNQSYTTQPTEPVATPTCPAMSHTAWWRIAGTGQAIKLSTLDSNFDTVLAVYDQVAGDPTAANRIACNDGPLTSEVTFPSLRGRSYLVQVGGHLASSGTIGLTASSAVRPANDDRVSAADLASDMPATVSNAGASQEIGELLTCATTGYAATTWFRWTASAIGDLVLSTSAAFETALTVYRAGDGAVLACATGIEPRVSLRVTPGDAFLLQVAAKGADGAALGQGPIATTAAFTVDPDADHDGELASTDCNDNNAAIRHGVVDNPDDGIDQDCSGGDAVNLDRDGDGFNRGPGGRGDCNDADPKIHPQAVDIPGNAIDEDCSGGPAPFPRLMSSVTYELTLPFRFLSLRVLRAVAGSRIELRCRGAGCFKRKAIKVRKTTAVTSLVRFVAKARPKRGAVVEVRITKPGTIGFMKRFTGRGAKKKPKVEELCLAAGTGRSQHC